MEPLVVKAILQPKSSCECSKFPMFIPQIEVVQKSLVVDSSSTLTNKD